MRKSIMTAVTFCLIAGGISHAEEETRIFVKYPEALKQQMLSNMRDHMAALNEIVENLAYDDPEKAAEIAETRLGLGARHAHGTADLAKYMPPGMREAGFNMHSAASRFAKVAAKGNTEEALEALTAVTQACVECHAGYRVK